MRCQDDILEWLNEFRYEVIIYIELFKKCPAMVIFCPAVVCCVLLCICYFLQGFHNVFET